MATSIDDVSRVLGLSPRGVRLRVDALRDVIAPHLRKAENNRILFDGEALAILRRLEDLRQAKGQTVRQAAVQIREELDGNNVKPLRQSTENTTSNGEIAALREMIEELRSERDHWRELAGTLQEQVAALTPLALPRPRRWFAWLRGRGGIGHTTT